MTCFNKEHYKSLKKIAKNDNIHVETHMFHDEYYNGISVAFGPMTNSVKGRMLQVAVSYCAVEDKFKPKHGKYQALLKLYNGEFVQVPLAEFYHDNGVEETSDALIQFFAI